MRASKQRAAYVFLLTKWIIDLTLTTLYYSVNQQIIYMFYFKSILWQYKAERKRRVRERKTEGKEKRQ